MSTKFCCIPSEIGTFFYKENTVAGILSCSVYVKSIMAIFKRRSAKNKSLFGVDYAGAQRWDVQRDAEHASITLYVPSQVTCFSRDVPRIGPADKLVCVTSPNLH